MILKGKLSLELNTRKQSLLTQIASGEIHAFSEAKVILVHRWPVLLAVIIFFVSAGIFYNLTRANYSIEVTIGEEDPSSSPLGALAGASSLGALAGRTDAVDNDLAFLQSHAFQYKVAEKIIGEKSFAPMVSHITSRNDSILSVLRSKFLDVPEDLNSEESKKEKISNFIGTIAKFKRVIGQNYIILTVKHSNPDLCVNLTNLMASLAVKLLMEQDLEIIQSANTFVNGQIEELSQRMRKLVVGTKREREMVFAEVTKNTAGRRFVTLEENKGQVKTKLEINRRMVREWENLISSWRSASDTASVNQEKLYNSIEDLSSQFEDDARLEVEGLDQTSRQRQEVESKIRSLVRSLTPVAASAKPLIRTRIAGILRESEELNLRLNKTQQGISESTQSLNSAGMVAESVDEAKRNTELELRVFEELKMKNMELEVTQLSRKNKIRVLEDAKKAMIKPKLSLIGTLLLCLIVGAIVGSGLMLLLEELDGSVRNSTEIEELGLALFGGVPRFRSEGASPWRLYNPFHFKVANIERRSLQSRAFRKMGKRVQSLSKTSPPAQVIAITSAENKEGKSLVAYHLSETLAREGEKVLLIDFNLRTPNLTGSNRSFRFHGEQDFFEGTKNMLEHNKLPGFHYLIARKVFPDATMLEEGEKFGELMAKLRSTYDHIIFDTDGVLTAGDAIILARLSDVVLLVARQRFTGSHALLKAFHRLRRTTQTPVFAVMNGYSRREEYVDAVFRGGGTIHLSTAPKLLSVSKR